MEYCNRATVLNKSSTCCDRIGLFRSALPKCSCAVEPAGAPAKRSQISLLKTFLKQVATCNAPQAIEELCRYNDTPIAATTMRRNNSESKNAYQSGVTMCL